MSPMLQTLATVLVVAGAVAYLVRSAWRGYVRVVRARRLADRERLCDPDCCGH